jgi:DNA-directed RNA polymerase specialized sigma24 family protein
MAEPRTVFCDCGALDAADSGGSCTRVFGRQTGGPGWKVPLADNLGATMPRDVHVLDLDAALRKLETIDSRLGELVVLRFFGGMTVEEAAEGLGLSPATVKRDWSRAWAWLFRELRRVVH